MILGEEKINEIVSVIVREVHPERVYLFGSYAKGRATEWSDVDLMVVADIPGPKHQRSLAIHKLFSHRDFSLDLIVRTREEFESEMNLPNTLGQIVAREGKLLYAQ